MKVASSKQEQKTVPLTGRVAKQTRQRGQARTGGTPKVSGGAPSNTTGRKSAGESNKITWGPPKIVKKKRGQRKANRGQGAPTKKPAGPDVPQSRTETTESEPRAGPSRVVVVPVKKPDEGRRSSVPRTKGRDVPVKKTAGRGASASASAVPEHGGQPKADDPKRVTKKNPIPIVNPEKTSTGHRTTKKQQPAGLAPKKPYRYRAGTVALRAVNRNDDIDDNLNTDPDFVVGHQPDPDVQIERETRMSKMKFLKAAKGLEPLALDHDPDDESFPFYTFFLACYNNGARLVKLVQNTVLITPQGSWYASYVRHLGDASKQASIRRSAGKNDGIPSMFWQKGTTTISTAVMDIRRYRVDSKKPIAVLMGEQHVTTGAGHAVIVILYFDQGEWKAIMKDCLPHAQMMAYSLSMNLLRDLGIDKALLVSELEREGHILRTCCVKESFVYAASVMEGIFPGELLGQPKERTKMYSVTCKKYI